MCLIETWGMRWPSYLKESILVVSVLPCVKWFHCSVSLHFTGQFTFNDVTFDLHEGDVTLLPLPRHTLSDPPFPLHDIRVGPEGTLRTSDSGKPPSFSGCLVGVCLQSRRSTGRT